MRTFSEPRVAANSSPAMAWRDKALRVAIWMFCAAISAVSSYARAIEQQSDDTRSQRIARESPLDERVSPAPESLLHNFDKHLTTPTSAHVVTPSERIVIRDALARLAPRQRDVLRKRLHAIYFIDGLPNNAMTFPDGGKQPAQMFSIAVRAGALHESVSDLITRKERTLFDATGSELSVEVEAGNLNALVYVLLHEATHVLALSDEATALRNSLLSGIWQDDRLPLEEYREPILMIVLWRSGRAIPIAEADKIYDALDRTPFISVYGSTSSHDDLAELVAWTELTGRLRQPYRILLSSGPKIIRVIEPAKSERVRKRIREAAQLTGY